MKIDLKLSPQQLGALVFSFNTISKLSENDRQIKVARSVLDKTVLKLRKKHLETESTQTLFSKKMKINFSLEYYEAHYLELFLVIMQDVAMCEYDRNVLNFIKSTLNQKLA